MEAPVELRNFGAPLKEAPAHELGDHVRHHLAVTADLVASMRALADGLRGRASLEAELEVGVAFDPRIDASLVLLDAGEHVVGFESLLSNLYEFDVAVTEAEFEVITKLAAAWGLEDEQWTYVAELRPRQS